MSADELAREELSPEEYEDFLRVRELIREHVEELEGDCLDDCLEL